jgi:hypothetical protein
MTLRSVSAVNGTGTLAHFLDDLRAAEAASARVFGAWVEVCALDGLRGGLRAITEREAAHAELLAARLVELGGACVAAVSERALTAALHRYGAPGVADEEKLRLVLARYPEDRTATRTLDAVVAGLEDDPETRELLRLVAQGEVASIGWLRAYRDGLAVVARPPGAA